MTGEAPISPWVILKPGVPVRVHFTDHRRVDRAITDPITGQPKSVDTLMFTVDFEDGKPVSKSFSCLSQRLASELSAYLPGKRYVHFGFVLVKEGPGTVAPRVLRVEPWTRF